LRHRENSDNKQAKVNPVRLLLVDDHALVRAGIRALIEMVDGFEVVAEAGNGHDALRAIEQLRPDVVLLDVTMPGMNGFEVLKETTARFSDVRVIMLTMHEAREYAIQALHCGASAFIPKSAAAAELKDAIQTVMSGRTYVATQTGPHAEAMAGEDLDQRLLQRLTPRQREILVRMAEGQTTNQIARSLNISVKTVESHRSQLTERLDIHDIAGLVRFAIRTGLVKMGFAMCLATAHELASPGNFFWN
jgi:DNA-binding NarL/FixJ family response regulator